MSLEIELDKITKSNKKDLFELVSNINVMKYVGKGNVWTNEKTNKFINYCLKEENTNNKNTLFLKIINKNNGAFIGIIGIHKYEETDKDYELTYYIKKQEQGKGIGSNALKLMLNKFHEIHPNVKRVLSDTLSNNIPAQKSLIKNGFMFLKKVKRSGKDYFRYQYLFKFHKLLSVEYPYLKYFMKKSEMKKRFEKLKTLKFDQLNENKKVIHIDYNVYKEYNRITDYFTNECRMDCIFKGEITPFEYYQKNRGVVLLNSLIKNKFSYDKFEEYMYEESGMCNNFQVSIIMNIFSHFKPKRILDSSAGWGDRLVASIAYSQKNNSTVSYTGADPNKCLKPLYKKIIKELATEEEKKEKLFRVINKPFEKLTKKDLVGDYDLAFTSPPFWDLEVYENNKNQSIFGFKTEKEWVEGFLNKLAQINIDNLVKGGHLVIYVPDYKDFMDYMKNNKEVEYKGIIQFTTGGKMRNIYVWKKL